MEIIKSQQVKLEREIGMGAYGKVVRATYVDKKNVNIKVAVKIFKDQKNYPAQKYLMSEKAFYDQVRHVNILHLMGYSLDADFRALVFELGLHDLTYYIRNRMECPISYVSDIAKSLDYIHNGLLTPIAHLDIKPNNFIVVKLSEDSNIVKMSDFGLAQELTSSTIKLEWARGTIGYSS